MRRFELVLLLFAVSWAGCATTSPTTAPPASPDAELVVPTVDATDSTSTDFVARLRVQRDEILAELSPRLERPATPADSLAVMTLSRLASVLALYDPDPQASDTVHAMLEGLWPAAAPRAVDEHIAIVSLLIEARLAKGDLDGADAHADRMLAWFASDGFARHSAVTTRRLPLEDLGRALRDAGRADRAEDLYRRAVATGPPTATVGCFRGLLSLLAEQDRRRELQAICAAELELERRYQGRNPRAEVAREFLARDLEKDD